MTLNYRNPSRVLRDWRKEVCSQLNLLAGSFFKVSNVTKQGSDFHWGSLSVSKHSCPISPTMALMEV